jgi:hypothetical protein
VPPIVRIGPRDHQPALLERREHSTEVARIEAERVDDLGGRRVLAVGELVQNADFGEREAAVDVRIAERADTRRIEAIEVSDCLGVVIELAHDSSFGETVDFVNYPGLSSFHVLEWLLMNKFYGFWGFGEMMRSLLVSQSPARHEPGLKVERPRGRFDR